MKEIKTITITEMEEKIKQFKEIESVLSSPLKVVKDNKVFNSLTDIDVKCNDIIIKAGKEKLKEMRIAILEELQEHGIMEHSIKPLKK